MTGGKRARAWWWSAGPICFGVLVVVACAAILLEDKLMPPKPVDVRDKVTLSGGGTFCDPVPLPPGQRAEGQR